MLIRISLEPAMRMLGLAVFFSLFASPMLAAQLDFKGLVLGAQTTPDAVVAALATECEALGKQCDETWKKIHDRMAVSCGAGGTNGDIQVCNGNTTIAGVQAKANVVIGPQGHLQRLNLTISAYSYDAVLAEITSKFGKPASTRRSTVQNAFGASFPQVQSIWNGADGQSLTVSRYAGSRDDASINFSTAADRDMLHRAAAGDPSDL